MIRKLERAEYEQAALLALNIYMQCGTETYILILHSQRIP